MADELERLREENEYYRRVMAERREANELIVSTVRVFREENERLRERVEAALDLAVRYGGVDGDHHKAWVIDQMVRALAGDNYERLVAEACAGEDGPQTYSWDVGVAP